MKRLLHTIFLVFLFVITTTAQIVELPLTHNPVLHKKNKPKQATSQRQSVSLPFFDDFSSGNLYPDSDKWLDNLVFVNTTFGANPPSVGVATFDGVDAGGTPYALTGGNIPSDTLTSVAIDLAGLSEVYLSFYVQPNGYGDRPEMNDSLLLEFKNQWDEWILIDSYTGLSSNIPNDSIFPFVRYTYDNFVSDFLYDGFQFRFRNKSNGTGVVDNWHLDYVLLDDTAPEDVFSDVAFTQLPDDILDPYSSMPWVHFEEHEAAELDRNISTGIFNHNNQISNAGGSRVSLRETRTETQVYEAQLYNGTLANVDSIALRLDTFDLNSSDPLTFPNVWSGLEYLATMQNSFNGSDELHFELRYDLVASLNDVTSNDVVARTTVFDNYFAYDDGSAEGNIAAQGSGSQVAVRFHANKADSLKAIQLYIPRYNTNVTVQQFNLNVWVGELEGDPDYQLLNQTPLYIDNVADSLYGFTTYRFQDANTGALEPLAIPAGDFYIGWEQVTNEFGNAIPVGLDKNNAQANQFMWGFVDGTWSVVDYIQGIAMIRPIVGEGVPPNTSVRDPLDATTFRFSPNPVSDMLHIQLEAGRYDDYQIAVFDQLGRLHLQQRLMPTLSVAHLPTGMYFIKIQNLQDHRFYTEKVLVQR